MDGSLTSSLDSNRLSDDKRKGRDGWGPGGWEHRNGVSSFGWDSRRPIRCPRCPQPGDYRGNGYDNLSPEWERRLQQDKDYQGKSHSYVNNCSYDMHQHQQTIIIPYICESKARGRCKILIKSNKNVNFLFKRGRTFQVVTEVTERNGCGKVQ